MKEALRFLFRPYLTSKGKCIRVFGMWYFDASLLSGECIPARENVPCFSCRRCPIGRAGEVNLENSTPLVEETIRHYKLKK